MRPSNIAHDAIRGGLSLINGAIVTPNQLVTGEERLTAIQVYSLDALRRKPFDATEKA